MKLSIIVPAFNEEKTVEEIIEKVIDIPLSGIKKDIIVVDDASTDATPSILDKVKKKHAHALRVYRHPANRGKGAAVKTGLQHAQGDYVLIQDADLEYNPTDIQRLVDPVMRKESEVVYGTRLKRLPNFSRDERTPRFFMHYLGNKMLSLLTSLLYGQWISDMETGYKLFPRTAVGNIPLHARSFELEPEITAKLLKRGFRITEIPIATNPRGYEEGKKLNMFRDGPLALWTLVKYRFVD